MSTIEADLAALLAGMQNAKPTDGCPKCKGTGQFVTYSGRVHGECFACKGTGKAAPKAAGAVSVDASKIQQAFDTARSKATRPGQQGIMIRPIKLQSGDVTVKFTPGSIGSQWEGMLFAKSGDKKLGAIKDGRFQRKFECTDAEAAAVLDCASNPEKAAVAYGKAWSTCGICGRGLLNDESIARGIGPICAAKFGW